MAFAALGTSQGFHAAAQIEQESSRITKDGIFWFELSWMNTENHFYLVLFSLLFCKIYQLFSICFATLPENKLDTKGRHINKHVA